MNQKRRKKLDAISKLIIGVGERIEAVLAEEENCRDNMPENLSGSDAYSASEDSCDAMQRAIDALESAVEEIEEARA